MSAVMLLGEIARALRVALGPAATKLTVAVREALPAVAAMVLLSAFVAVSALVARPLPSVVVVGEPSTSFVLLLENDTAWYVTALAYWSRTVKLMVVAAPTTWLLGVTARAEKAAFGDPDVVVTVAVTLPLPAPRLAVSVRAWATALRNVVVKWPAPSVLPLGAAMVSELPFVLSKIVWPATALR